MRGSGNRSFQRRIRAKHVQADVLVPLMLERLDMQIVARVDILADFQDHRLRLGGAHIGPDDLGKLVADLVRDIAGIFLPPAVSLG